MFLSNSGMMLGGNNNNNNNGAGSNSGAGLGVGINNGQMQGNPNGVQPPEGGMAGAAPDYSLAGILHYLQSEWRRYEKDRNEWEIERAEMRARIALLEGERRGVENLKTDLMRRVKMLEYALRQERSKYLSSTTNASLPAVPPQVKNPLLQGLEKAASSSGRSSPAPMFEAVQGGAGNALPPNLNAGGVGAAAVNNSLLGGANASAIGAQVSRASSSAKDPKSRAKSREYLKQCLQEISYLTSATTLNPLPDRGVASGSQTGANAAQPQQRPRMVMSENVPPPLARPAESQPSLAGTVSRGNAAGLGIPNTGFGKGGRPGRSPLFAETLVEEGNEAEEGQSNDWQARSGAQPPHNPLSATFVDPNEGNHASERDEDSSSQSTTSESSQSSTSSASLTDNDLEGGDQVTAIYKPGGRDLQKLKDEGIASRDRRDAARQNDKAEAASILSEAQQQLAITSDKVNQLMNRSAKKDGEDDLANLSLLAEDEDAAKKAEDAAADSLMWKSKKVLRSHLDAVRAIAFSQSDLCLLSASDDNTIKFWNSDLAGATLNATKSGTDSAPLITFRGHSAAVTSLALSTSKQRFYSASLDSSIRVWQLPDKNTEPYPPFDKATELGCLVGHSQAVWDLALLPDRSDEEGLLASASADGTVKVWAVRNSSQDGQESVPAELQLSWDYFGSDPSAELASEREKLLKEGALPVPTSVDSCHSDLRLVAVGYSNSVVKLFELDTGRQAMQLKSNQTYDGTPGTQINKIVTHPTLPMLISAHEDGYIRMFDLDTGACTLSMVAHLDAVTSLDIDASGLTLVSGGHDCSVRFWDIAGGSLSVKDSSVGADTAQGAATTAVCRQEISSHRKKAGEGVLAVKYHPTAPFFASAGADGVVRIYG